MNHFFLLFFLKLNLKKYRLIFKKMKNNKKNAFTFFTLKIKTFFFSNSTMKHSPTHNWVQFNLKHRHNIIVVGIFWKRREEKGGSRLLFRKSNHLSINRSKWQRLGFGHFHFSTKPFQFPVFSLFSLQFGLCFQGFLQGFNFPSKYSTMETPSSQPKRRGRPKGSSTKSKDEKEKEPHSTGRMRGSVDKRAAAIDEQYVQWKSLVPVLYDWFANHNLVWPSLSCRYMCLFFSFLKAYLVCCTFLEPLFFGLVRLES